MNQILIICEMREKKEERARRLRDYIEKQRKLREGRRKDEF